MADEFDDPLFTLGYMFGFENISFSQIDCYVPERFAEDRGGVKYFFINKAGEITLVYDINTVRAFNYTGVFFGNHLKYCKITIQSTELDEPFSVLTPITSML